MTPTITETLAAGRIVLHRHPSRVDPRRDLRDIREGLLSAPREIPSRFFYDERGGDLYDRITGTPEYYPYGAEREILEREAARIVDLTGATDLVELGSGASTKTRILLDAMHAAGSLKHYVPVDVNEPLVQKVAEELVEDYERLTVEGHVGDYEAGLHHLPLGGGRLVIFLGGTIGNLGREEGLAFLTEIVKNLDRGDYFLLGTDLVKDMDVLEEAYNDAEGLTAEFNRNILRVVNRIAGADFRPENFAHRAFFDPERSRIEMRLLASSPQSVRLSRLHMEIFIPRADAILTEISNKFTFESAESLLREAGFELVEWLTDERRRYALSLARCAQGS